MHSYNNAYDNRATLTGLRLGVHVDERGYGNETALMVAVANGRLEAVQALLRNGETPLTRDSSQAGALCHASITGKQSRYPTHAKIRTASRFWRSQILGISPGNASEFEQEKYCSNRKQYF